MSKKICYIAHAISGDIAANLADLCRIVRKINLEYPDVVPFCPYYVDIVSLDDTIQAERDRGNANNVELLSRGFIDEVWLTGKEISQGVREEIILAAIHNIPVKNMMLRFAPTESLLEEDDKGNVLTLDPNEIDDLPF